MLWVIFMSRLIRLVVRFTNFCTNNLNCQLSLCAMASYWWGPHVSNIFNATLHKEDCVTFNFILIAHDPKQWEKIYRWEQGSVHKLYLPLITQDHWMADPCLQVVSFPQWLLPNSNISLWNVSCNYSCAETQNERKQVVIMFHLPQSDCLSLFVHISLLSSMSSSLETSGWIVGNSIKIGGAVNTSTIYNLFKKTKYKNVNVILWVICSFFLGQAQ